MYYSASTLAVLSVWTVIYVAAVLIRDSWNRKRFVAEEVDRFSKTLQESSSSAKPAPKAVEPSQGVVVAQTVLALAALAAEAYMASKTPTSAPVVAPKQDPERENWTRFEQHLDGPG